MAAPRARRAWLAQCALYALFALVVGTFSRWPPYRHLAADLALVKLSLVHAGKPVADCRSLAPAELEKLPPNMRAPVQCPRERSPVIVEVDIDGATVVRAVAAPSGLARDGASSIYRRLPVAAGEREISVRLRDDARSEGFAYTLQRPVRLAPAQVLVIDFDAGKGGITLQ
jgi:hypothetical protein